MDQVFDFREFFLTLLRRFKLLLILALVCGILGGLFGFAVKADGFSGDLRDTYTVTSVVSGNLNRQEKRCPALQHYDHDRRGASKQLFPNHSDAGWV